MIARLPQLERLDGKEITRTDRIKAQQRLPALREEIAPLAQEVPFVWFPLCCVDISIFSPFPLFSVRLPLGFRVSAALGLRSLPLVVLFICCLFIYLFLVFLQICFSLSLSFAIFFFFLFFFSLSLLALDPACTKGNTKVAYVAAYPGYDTGCLLRTLHMIMINRQPGSDVTSPPPSSPITYNTHLQPLR